MAAGGSRAPGDGPRSGQPAVTTAARGAPQAVPVRLAALRPAAAALRLPRARLVTKLHGCMSNGGTPMQQRGTAGVEACAGLFQACSGASRGSRQPPPADAARRECWVPARTQRSVDPRGMPPQIKASIASSILFYGVCHQKTRAAGPRPKPQHTSGAPATLFVRPVPAWRAPPDTSARSQAPTGPSRGCGPRGRNNARPKASDYAPARAPALAGPPGHNRSYHSEIFGDRRPHPCWTTPCSPTRGRGAAPSARAVPRRVPCCLGNWASPAPRHAC